MAQRPTLLWAIRTNMTAHATVFVVADSAAAGSDSKALGSRVEGISVEGSKAQKHFWLEAQRDFGEGSRKTFAFQPTRSCKGSKTFWVKD